MLAAHESTSPPLERKRAIGIRQYAGLRSWIRIHLNAPTPAALSRTPSF
jgi:hypothetical protein